MLVFGPTSQAESSSYPPSRKSVTMRRSRQIYRRMVWLVRSLEQRFTIMKCYSSNKWWSVWQPVNSNIKKMVIKKLASSETRTSKTSAKIVSAFALRAHLKSLVTMRAITRFLLLTLNGPSTITSTSTPQLRSMISLTEVILNLGT